MHKKLVHGMANKFKLFLEGNFYEGLQVTFPRGMLEEGLKEINERLDQFILELSVDYNAAFRNYLD